MKNKYIPLILIICPAIWISCSKSQKKNTALPPTPVDVQAAEKTNAIYYDQFPGTVVALNSVELRSQVTGFITGIYFKEGDVVPKGKILYEIDRRLYEAAYQQAQANLSSAQASYVRAQKDADRYTQLATARCRCQPDFRQCHCHFSKPVKARLPHRQRRYLSARANLSYAIIRAPFTGRIGISQVKLGAQIAPGRINFVKHHFQQKTLLQLILWWMKVKSPVLIRLQNKKVKQSRFYFSGTTC